MGDPKHACVSNPKSEDLGLGIQVSLLHLSLTPTIPQMDLDIESLVFLSSGVVRAIARAKVYRTGLIGSRQVHFVRNCYLWNFSR